MQENGVYGVPAIVIEIISTNRAYNTKRKRSLYEKAGVRECFMIDPENKKPTLLTLNSSGIYEQIYEDTGISKSGILNCNIFFRLAFNFVIFVTKMKFYEKYPRLREKEFLTQVLTNTVFSTMSLEDQEVPKLKVKEIVLTLLSEEELKGSQFFSDQVH